MRKNRLSVLFLFYALMMAAPGAVATVCADGLWVPPSSDQSIRSFWGWFAPARKTTFVFALPDNMEASKGARVLLKSSGWQVMRYDADVMLLRGGAVPDGRRIRVDGESSGHSRGAAVEIDLSDAFDSLLSDGFEPGEDYVRLDLAIRPGWSCRVEGLRFQYEGIPGEPGPPGPVGPKGEKGEKGDIGPRGLKGNTGDIGPQGPKGEAGAVGPRGYKGEKGDMGPQGVQGVAGPKGETGDVGPQGPKGDAGDTGPQGLAGPSGEMGPAGPQYGFYMPGIVSSTFFEDCTQVDKNDIQCEKKEVITVSVPDEGEVVLEGTVVETIEKLGEPTTLERSIRIRFSRQPVADRQPVEKAYEVRVELAMEGWQHAFAMSPEDPAYSSEADPAYNKNTKIKGKLLTDSLVSLVLDLDGLKVVETESIGIIKGKDVDVEVVSAHDARLTVEISNEGQLATNYIVNVRQCSAPIDLVTAANSFLEVQESRTQFFDLHAPEGWTVGEEQVLTVYLESPTGKIYDKVAVYFTP